MVFLPDTTFDNCPPSLDVIYVDGGFPQMKVVGNPEVLEFFEKQGGTAKFITSVCSGSEFFLRVGLLEDCQAATHRATRDQLANLGVQIGTEEVVSVYFPQL